jgi:hypothetical protein
VLCWQYADGFSYSKGKMEEAYRAGGILEKTPTKAIKDPSTLALKREDVDLIVRFHFQYFPAFPLF